MKNARKGIKNILNLGYKDVSQVTHRLQRKTLIQTLKLLVNAFNDFLTIWMR